MMYAYGPRMSFVYKCSLSVTMIVTWLINGVLFWRLVKSDVLRSGRREGDRGGGGGSGRKTKGVGSLRMESTESGKTVLTNNNNPVIEGCNGGIAKRAF